MRFFVAVVVSNPFVLDNCLCFEESVFFQSPRSPQKLKSIRAEMRAGRESIKHFFRSYIWWFSQRWTIDFYLGAYFMDDSNKLNQSNISNAFDRFKCIDFDWRIRMSLVSRLVISSCQLHTVCSSIGHLIGWMFACIRRLVIRSRIDTHISIERRKIVAN